MTNKLKKSEKTRTDIRGRLSELTAVLKSPYTISLLGIMGALKVVLLYAATINISQFLHIGFSYIPGMVIGSFFGPAIGGIFGGVMDIVGYFVKPEGPFFPGFTFNAILAGMIYGLFLHNKKPTVLRVVLCTLTEKVIVNLVFNTMWLCLLYNMNLKAIILPRIASNAALLPIDAAFTFCILKALDRIPYTRKIKAEGAA